MNNKIKLIKNKLNAAMILIEEIQNLLEEFPELDTESLLNALDELETQYWVIEEFQD